MTMQVSAFTPPSELTVAFVVLSLMVVALDVLIVRRAAPEDKRARWTAIAVGVALAWLAIHALVAESGLLERATTPPPIAPYLLVTNIAALWLSFSRVGLALARLPLAILVGLQVFRAPLEWILHALYSSGDLPIQMTWSGRNFDVLTGISAAAVAYLAHRGGSDRVVFWWNVIGLGLLINVVGIALLSSPLPIRHFMNEPALLLPFHAPFNWIVNVHVWTALVSHLVLFRALALRRRERS